MAVDINWKAIRPSLRNLWWYGVAALRFLQSGTSAVPRSAQDKMREAVSVKDFGAVGDGVTDDYAAFNAAIAALAARSVPGARLLVPNCRYRLSQKLSISSHIIIEGEGWGQNPGQVDGVTYSHPNNYYGSVLVFDAGVSGLEFHPFTLNETYPPANPADYTEWSAYHSGISDLMIVSMTNGAAGANYGIRSRTRLVGQNVRVYGFGSDGLLLEASSDGLDGVAFGNANLSNFSNCTFDYNGRHGAFVRGRDANAVTFVHCDFKDNGGWGLNMENVLGNTVVGPHFSTNNRLLAADADATVGSIRTTGGVACHVITGAYIESGNGSKTSMVTPTMFIGGQGAPELYHPTASTAFILNNGEAIRRAISGSNTMGAATVKGGLGQPPSLTGNVAFWFGSTDDPAAADGDGYKFHREFVTADTWEMVYANSISARILQLVSNGHASTALANGYALGLPNGLYLGLVNDAPRLVPAQNSMPASGTYRRGDFVLNSEPSIAAGKVMIGWSRLTSGSGHVAGTDWTTCYVTTT